MRCPCRNPNPEKPNSRATGGEFEGRARSDVAEAQLKEQFSEFGPITNIAYKQGFAFIDFDDTRDAQDAISKMSGADTWGNQLHFT